MSKYSSKLIAEEILSLSIYYLNQKKIFDKNLGFSHTISWSDNEGNVTSRINISIIDNEKDRFAVLKYLINGNEIRQEIYLQSQKCNLGGNRLWFICPFCHSRVGKLYFSGGSFVCRRCGDVTYSSKNINRKSNFYILYNCINMDKRLGELQSKITKKYYKNKPTKPFKKYLHLYNKLHSYDSLLEKINNTPGYFEHFFMS